MVVMPINSSIGNLFNSIGHFVNPSLDINSNKYEESNNYSNMHSSQDKDLFEDDIIQSSKDLNNFTSPLLMIDT